MAHVRGRDGHGVDVMGFGTDCTGQRSRSTGLARVARPARAARPAVGAPNRMQPLKLLGQPARRAICGHSASRDRTRRRAGDRMGLAGTRSVMAGRLPQLTLPESPVAGTLTPRQAKGVASRRRNQHIGRTSANHQPAAGSVQELARATVQPTVPVTLATRSSVLHACENGPIRSRRLLAAGGHSRFAVDAPLAQPSSRGSLVHGHICSARPQASSGGPCSVTGMRRSPCVRGSPLAASAGLKRDTGTC